MAVIGAVEEYANLSRILWKARQLCHDNYFPCVLTMKISCIGCALESTNGCCTKVSLHQTELPSRIQSVPYQTAKKSHYCHHSVRKKTQSFNN